MEKATNGQFREFVGKLLVKGSDEKVALIDKTKIQNAIDSLSQDEIVMKNFIKFINNGCRLQVDGFVSRIFEKTNVIKVAKNPNSFKIKESSIRDFIRPIIKREEELKNPEPSIDNDLWNYFSGKTVPGISEDFSSTIYRFLSRLTHEQILEEAENTGIKKVYSFLEGFSIIREAILAGEVDKRVTGIICYFKVEGIDTMYRFNAYRDGGGPLRVDVGKVYFGNALDAGDGACFSN